MAISISLSIHAYSKYLGDEKNLLEELALTNPKEIFQQITVLVITIHTLILNKWGHFKIAKNMLKILLTHDSSKYLLEEV